ncbi:MAG: tRNA-dihydrouridine synthase family protein, partial [Candidatus Moranbacteria bacterium]|nr:tRNA-dihydrouridine synthase family protein [Candidatus Moranbacteria bacterium]
LAEKYSPTEKNYIVQIFGSNIESMMSAAKTVEEKIHPMGININLGCPVPKAKKAGYGACQMGNIPSIEKIVREIKRNISLPLSIKTRLGLSDPKEILSFAPKLEKAGIDCLIVHARTLPGMFHQNPNWEIVEKLTQILKIPIVYNGGIKSPEDALFYAQKTGCTQLMIGQAAIGNPWIFSQIKNFLQTGKYSNPSEGEKKKTILRHAELVEKYFGEKGLVIFRAHLASYLKNIPNASTWRARAVQIKNLRDVKEIIKEIHFN